MGCLVAILFGLAFLFLILAVGPIGACYIVAENSDAIWTILIISFIAGVGWTILTVKAEADDSKDDSKTPPDGPPPEADR